MHLALTEENKRILLLALTEENIRIAFCGDRGEYEDCICTDRGEYEGCI